MADVVAVALALVVAWLLGRGFEAPAGKQLLLLAGVLPLWVIGASIYGLYDADKTQPARSSLDDIAPVFHVASVIVWLTFAAVSLAGAAGLDVRETFAFWSLAITFVVAARGMWRFRRRGSPANLENTIVVGAGEVGQLIARKLLVQSGGYVNIVGFVDSEQTELAEDLDHLALLGTLEDLPRLVRLFDVERVVFAFWDEPEADALARIRDLRDLDVRIDIAPRLFEIIGPNANISTIAGFPLVGLPPARLSRSARVAKRAMDIAVSALGLALCAPLFGVIALLIKLDSPGPVFFRQVRMGARDRTFSVFKFRTMSLDAETRKSEFAHLNEHALMSGDGRLFKVANDPRVTRVGKVLRRYFLDELPQLINVVRGEMSLVGPRPLVLDEDRHVDEWARRRLDLRPGMTGLWQVLGHRAIPFGEMMKLDYLYVTTWSLRNDLRLIVRTIPLVVKGGGGPY